ncbi:hypothetical protein B0H11DRAFT_2220502 [Mycena galericulata]|nr:hypothetical protein B0H11DRAFT_2220502 [Mycena galericulata]
MSALNSNHIPTQLFPPVGQFAIGNVKSHGGLLFENPSGAALVDFRRTGGHVGNTRRSGRQVTFWNVGTGNPLSLTDKFTEDFSAKATEFTITFAGYPFYTIEAPVSGKLWDIEGHYPSYAHAPTHNDRISICWEIRYP